MRTLFLTLTAYVRMFIWKMQSQRQSLVQQQRLNLSPQLVQSIKLMALPYADLRDRILEEVEKNPALEIEADPREEGMAWEDSAAHGEAASASDAKVNDAGDGYEIGESFDAVDIAGSSDIPEWTRARDAALGSDVPDTYGVSSSGEEESDDHQDFIEGVLHHDETLQEHLLSQLGDEPMDDAVRGLANLIIQNLDVDGFHIVPPSELPGGGDQHTLEAALSVVRRLEPVGCGTRDFRESLAVQARLLAGNQELERDPPLAHAVAIIERHFDALERARPDALVKALQKIDGIDFEIDLDEAEEILEIIRTLDPFPGRAWDHSPGAYIVPDVIVRRGNEGFTAEINGEEVPVLRISPMFRELEEKAEKGASQDASTAAARDFAREPVRDAQWFIHSLKRREETILKVAGAIIDFQREFFMYGPARVAPLRMKDVAEETGMHEATVSRAANGKYLRCEWGLFELKYFFSNQVGTGRNSSSSAAAASYTSGRFSKQSVKEVIRQIIEESKDGLSDQKISDILATRGIKVARRTVAKYRTELSLGSSFDR